MSVQTLLQPPTTTGKDYLKLYVNELNAKSVITDNLIASSLVSGTYTPTSTINNATLSVMLPATYTKIGDIVTVFYRFSVNITATTNNFEVKLQRPVGIPAISATIDSSVVSGQSSSPSPFNSVGIFLNSYDANNVDLTLCKSDGTNFSVPAIMVLSIATQYLA